MEQEDNLITDIDEIFGDDKPRIILDAEPLSNNFVPDQLPGRKKRLWN